MSRTDLDPALVRRFQETSVPTVVDILDYEFGLRTWLPPRRQAHLPHAHRRAGP